MVQTGSWSGHALWLSIPLGIFIAAFLWVNEFPDFLADRSAGKKNGVVRLGRRAASRLLPAIYAAGFALLALSVVAGLPIGVLLGFIALPSAAYACARVWAEPETFYRSYPVQPAALLTFVLYAVGAAAGFVVGR
jgi:1,4-dihydroxy-2-naphthoate octaprenyltransferase